MYQQVVTLFEGLGGISAIIAVLIVSTKKLFVNNQLLVLLFILSRSISISHHIR